MRFLLPCVDVCLSRSISESDRAIAHSFRAARCTQRETCSPFAHSLRNRSPSLQRWCANNLNSKIKGNNVSHEEEKKKSRGKWLLVFVSRSESDWVEGDFDFGLSVFTMPKGSAASLQESMRSCRHAIGKFFFYPHQKSLSLVEACLPVQFLSGHEIGFFKHEALMCVVFLFRNIIVFIFCSL